MRGVLIFSILLSLVFGFKKHNGYEDDTLPQVLSGHGFMTRIVLEALGLQEMELEQCSRTRTVPGFKLGEGILDVDRFYG